MGGDSESPPIALSRLCLDSHAIDSRLDYLLKEVFDHIRYHLSMHFAIDLDVWPLVAVLLKQISQEGYFSTCV